MLQIEPKLFVKRGALAGKLDKVSHFRVRYDRQEVHIGGWARHAVKQGDHESTDAVEFDGIGQSLVYFRQKPLPGRGREITPHRAEPPASGR